MGQAGFYASPTVWNRTAIVELSGSWDSYWSGREGAWLRRFRHAERKLAEQGAISYVRYRPAGALHNDGSPRWDLYDVCEEIARRSWQGAATNGTTLSHETVREFLRETHAAAAAAGAVDLNLLLLGGEPAAFIYGYASGGYVYGPRRGYDARRSREGAGNVLLAYTLRDSFARGDRLYDMGVGSLKSKRHFQTRLTAIMRVQPLRAAGVAGAVAPREAMVARMPAAVHRGRPWSGFHGRRTMTSLEPGGAASTTAGSGGAPHRHDGRPLGCAWDRRIRKASARSL